jgi:hypothetical protein
VVHTCNSSYSEDRNQEDSNLKRAWANSPQDPILKIPNKKGLLAQVVEASNYEALSSNPSASKKKKTLYFYLPYPILSKRKLR